LAKCSPAFLDHHTGLLELLPSHPEFEDVSNGEQRWVLIKATAACLDRLYQTEAPMSVRMAMAAAQMLQARFPELKSPAGMLPGNILFSMWFSAHLRSLPDRRCGIVASVLDTVGDCHGRPGMSLEEHESNELEEFCVQQAGPEEAEGIGPARAYILEMAQVSEKAIKRRWEESQEQAATESQHELKVASSLALYNYLATEDLLLAAIETAKMRDMPEAIVEGLQKMERIIFQQHRSVDVICTRQHCGVHGEGG